MTSIPPSPLLALDHLILVSPAEVKAAKNRVHLDIRVPPGDREPLADELVGLGGTVLAVYPRFTVLADPEGNELCLAAH